jgi:hypothetical protein
MIFKSNSWCTHVLLEFTPTYCLLEQSRSDLLLWDLQTFELELRCEFTEHYLCKQVLIFVKSTHSFSKHEFLS